jgi:predicted lipid-binding transport protein (Tim44 family)
MTPKFIVLPMIALSGLSMVGCAGGMVQTAYGEMPAYCTQNNTATGALVGTLLGAAVGGAIGGGRGAAIGAGSGLVLGGLTGAQADMQCRQIAHQRAVEMAFAAQAQAAASQSYGRRVAYQPVEYVTPSTGVRHKVTPLSSFTNPASKETCMAVRDVSFSADGKETQPATGRVCRGADGKMHEA